MITSCASLAAALLMATPPAVPPSPPAIDRAAGKTRGAESNPAEIGTLILEFGTLGRLTKKPVFNTEAHPLRRTW